MEDTLVHAISANGHIRYMALTSTQVVETARKIHDLLPTSTAALGRTLSVTLMLGAQLKDKDGQVVVEINGHGPCGTIIAIAKNDGTVKGMIANPNCDDVYPENGKLAVGKVVGTDGYLSVSRESYGHTPFVGKVKLQSGEIGDDFAYYFALSEQVPSVVSVGVLVRGDNRVQSAGALLIQLMPGHDETDIETVEKSIATLPPVSNLIDSGTDAQGLIEMVDAKASILSSMPVSYRCDCSKQRFHDALASLPKDELKELIEKDGTIEMQCHFCNRKMVFTKDDLADLLYAN